MAITVAQRAWMAGVVDLRGRIIYKSNKTRKWSDQVVLYVESVQLPIVNRLSAMTGGNPEMKARNRNRPDGWYRHGCDEHCPTAHVHVKGAEFSPAARWTISGSAMSVVLTSLMPYIIQDDGYTEAINYGFKHMKLWGQGAAATVTALRRLEGLGWPIPAIIEETRPGLFIKIRQGKRSTDADAEGRYATKVVPEEPDLPVVPQS